MNNISGIAASNGIAIAKAYILQTPDLSFEKKRVENPDSEIERFNYALETSKQELEKIKENTRKSIMYTLVKTRILNSLVMNSFREF